MQNGSSGRCWARALSREEWSLGALRNKNRSRCLEELPRHASCAFITPCSRTLSPEERGGGGGGQATVRTRCIRQKRGRSRHGKAVDDRERMEGCVSQGTPLGSTTSVATEPRYREMVGERGFV